LPITGLGKLCPIVCGEEENCAREDYPAQRETGGAASKEEMRYQATHLLWALNPISPDNKANRQKLIQDINQAPKQHGERGHDGRTPLLPVRVW
jgi:hypothetical protein